MKATTAKFKQIMATDDTRNYHVRINITLENNTTLTITDAEIWTGSFEIETACSGTNTFDIGSAIIGKCKFSLKNFDEQYNAYDFFNATAVVEVGLDGDVNNNNQQVYYRMGFYTMDEPTFAGALINLEMLDNMWKFDVPLSEVNLAYPITAGAAVRDICSYCGVTLNTQTFHGDNFTVYEAPKEEMNCREFISYLAMIGCNFCTINALGALVIRWYDPIAFSSLDGGTFLTTTTPYSDGDVADGGDFLDYTTGDVFDGGTFEENPNVDYFTRNFSVTVGTDEIAVTGVKFTIDKTDYSIGQDGYVLELENPLVTAGNVNSVLNLIWSVLHGFRFRTFNISTTSNLACEVGDFCAIMDLKGNYVYSFITNNRFTLNAQSVSCGAETPSRQLTKRYSKAAQAAVAVAETAAQEVITDYDLAVQEMNNLAINAMGAYQDYEDLATGGRAYYLSSMPMTKDENGLLHFSVHSIVFKATGDGFFVCQDAAELAAQCTFINGYNAQTGQLIVNVLNAIGVSAEWIKTGTLTIGGTGYATAPMLLIKNSSGTEIGRWTYEGLIVKQGTIEGTTINGGTINGTNITGGNGVFAVNGSTGETTITKGIIGDLTLENGEEYRYGTFNFGLKGVSAYSNREYNKGILYFTPAKCGIRSNFYISYNGSYPSQNRAIYLWLEYKSGSTWVSYSSQSMGYIDTSHTFGLINYQFSYTDTREWRIRAYVASASGNQSVTIDFHSDNVKILSISLNGIYGEHYGNFYGNGYFDSLDLGNMIISDTSITTEERIGESYNYLNLTYNELNFGDGNGSNTVNLSPASLTSYRNGTYYYVNFIQGSDERVKEDIEPLDIGLSQELIDKTEPKSFKYIDSDGTHYGMIAQDARAVLDELGQEDSVLEKAIDAPQTKVENQRMIEYDEYIPHLINYVKLLKAELNELKAELNALKGE